MLKPVFTLRTVCVALGTFLFTCASIVNAAIVTRAIETTLTSQNLDSFQLDVFGNPVNPRTDFTFQAAFVPDPDLTVGFAQVEIPFGTSNGVLIDAFTGDGFPSVRLLNEGDVVSQTSLFSFGSNETGNLYSFDSLNGASGNFGGRTGYVGLRFEDGTETFYGYALVTVNDISSSAPFDVTINSVTYNTIAGQGLQITAVPEPAGLLMLVGMLIPALLVNHVVRKSKNLKVLETMVP